MFFATRAQDDMSEASSSFPERLYKYTVKSDREAIIKKIFPKIVRTAHGRINAPNVHEQRKHSKIFRKFIRFPDSVAEILGGLSRIKDSLDVKLSKRQPAFGESATRIGPWIGKHSTGIRENVVENIVLKIAASERIVFGALDWNDFAGDNGTATMRHGCWGL